MTEAASTAPHDASGVPIGMNQRGHQPDARFSARQSADAPAHDGHDLSPVNDRSTPS